MLLPQLIHALAFLGGLAAMEGLTWAMHRWVMHGPLWCWHRSHHDPDRDVSFKPNDLFALVYVALAMVLFWIGLDVQWRVLWWMALGVTAYGLLYVLVHEGLLHRRIPLPLSVRRGYLLHHHTCERDGAVAFGFLWAPPERERPQGQRHGTPERSTSAFSSKPPR